MTDPEDDENDHVSQHPPHLDIDEFIQGIDSFRIERMSEDSVWLNIFSEDGDTDIHYDISCRGEGLHIKKRDEAAHREE